MKAWGLGLLVVASVVAGCSGKAAVPQGIPVDDRGEALPTVYGFVVDDAIRPIEGVEVRLLASGVNGTTDAAGRYEIRRPTFVAESVLLTAFKAGFVPLTHQVQLSGHRSARSDFRIEPDPHQMPRVDVLQHRGNLGCEAHVGGPASLGVSCDQPNPLALMADRLGPSVWTIDTTRGLAGAVVQVHWDAQSDLATNLQAQLRGPVIGCCEGETDEGMKGEVHAEATGPSPLRLELPEEAARAFPAWTALWLEVSLPPDQPGGPVAASIEQGFDAYASIFYVDAAPVGYDLQ